MFKWLEGRSALVITHPGQELLIHHWLEQARPVVFLLTDALPQHASGIQATARNLVRLNARPGTLFGRCTWEGLQRALMMQDHQRFVTLADELAEALEREKVDYVVGLSEERSPGNEVCRLMIDAAVACAARSLPLLRNYVAGIGECPASHCIATDEEGWLRKRRAILESLQLSPALRSRIEEQGIESLRKEFITPAVPFRLTQSFGKTSKESGDFQPMPDSPVSHSEHILPLAFALRDHAAGARSLERAA